MPQQSILFSPYSYSLRCFSFIRERLPGGAGQWFELNDTSVTPFDPARIPDQCFGKGASDSC